MRIQISVAISLWSFTFSLFMRRFRCISPNAAFAKSTQKSHIEAHQQLPETDAASTYYSVVERRVIFASMRSLCGDVDEVKLN